MPVLREHPMIRTNHLTAFNFPLVVLALSLCLLHTDYTRAAFIVGTPVNLGPVVNSEANENDLLLSHHGRTLYFHSNHPGGVGRSNF
jgi:hypothetical protein